MNVNTNWNYLIPNIGCFRNEIARPPNHQITVFLSSEKAGSPNYKTSQGLIYMLAQMDPRFVSGIFWFVIHALYETSTQWQKVLKRYLIYH